jgi:CheY-like chemotaxis protein
VSKEQVKEAFMSILVVDDNELNRKLLRVNLEADGLTVLEAGDGIEALERLNQHQVEVIISDILMPRMDGYRLCYEIRKNPQFNAIPLIIYSSSYTSSEDEKLALDCGADRFIKKPSSMKTIFETIHEVTRRATPSPHKKLEAASESEVMREYSERTAGHKIRGENHRTGTRQRCAGEKRGALPRSF